MEPSAETVEQLIRTVVQRNSSIEPHLTSASLSKPVAAVGALAGPRIESTAKGSPSCHDNMLLSGQLTHRTRRDEEHHRCRRGVQDAQLHHQMNAPKSRGAFHIHARHGSAQRAGSYDNRRALTGVKGVNRPRRTARQTFELSRTRELQAVAPLSPLPLTAVGSVAPIHRGCVRRLREDLRCM